MFVLQARDLLGWANQTEREMKMDPNVRDVNGADMLRQRHEEIRAEIEARQDTFASVIATGQALIANDHYAKDEVCQILSLHIMMGICLSQNAICVYKILVGIFFLSCIWKTQTAQLNII